MPQTDSPLRYPGGKTQLLHFVRELISHVSPAPTCYCEPFCGGAGVAMSLLLKNNVEKIIINDADFGIFSFWKSIVEETEKFIDTMDSTEISIDEWHRQRDIQAVLTDASHQDGNYSFELGFSTFYLNRTNVSGIIKGGVIGGLKQAGKNKIDCRFNKLSLSQKIRAISAKKDSIQIYNMDGQNLIRKVAAEEGAESTFMFVDPPYVVQGRNLYMNALTLSDHQALYDAIEAASRLKWIVTYDDCKEIREMYCSQDLRRYSIRYSANNRRKASELIALSNHFGQFSSSTIDLEKVEWDEKGSYNDEQ